MTEKKIGRLLTFWPPDILNVQDEDKYWQFRFEKVLYE